MLAESLRRRRRTFAAAELGPPEGRPGADELQQCRRRLQLRGGHLVAPPVQREHQPLYQQRRRRRRRAAPRGHHGSAHHCWLHIWLTLMRSSSVQASCAKLSAWLCWDWKSNAHWHLCLLSLQKISFAWSVGFVVHVTPKIGQPHISIVWTL